jgi:hypothetical protein
VIIDGVIMVDNPCKFCDDGLRYECVKDGKCNGYKSVVVCSNCDSICYKRDLIHEDCDGYNDLLCPFCHESVLKDYNIELRGTIRVYALDEESAHNIARKEIDKCDLYVTYCEEC